MKQYEGNTKKKMSESTTDKSSNTLLILQSAVLASKSLDKLDTITKNKTVINFGNYKSRDMIDFSNHLLTNYEQVRVANCTHLINM